MLDTCERDRLSDDPKGQPTNLHLVRQWNPKPQDAGSMQVRCRFDALSCAHQKGLTEISKPDTVTDMSVRSSAHDGLLAAAVEVFAAKGYTATRVSDIVREAGVAQGTFYLYFKSK